MVERHRRAWLRRLGFVLRHRRRNQRAGGRREDPLRREGEVRRSKHGHIGAGAAPPEQAQHPLWTEATTAAPEHKSRAHRGVKSRPRSQPRAQGFSDTRSAK
jgi:hypothetical protein